MYHRIQPDISKIEREIYIDIQNETSERDIHRDRVRKRQRVREKE